MRLLCGFLFISVSLAQTFTVSFPAALSSKPLDGRLLLLLSNDPSEEPRMQINETPKSQMVFGVTVDGWKPGTPVNIDDRAAGYPRAHPQDVPNGEYTIQAVLNIYETFHRADGKIINLAPDRGEGQHWNLAPGNLISTPRKVQLSRNGPPIHVALNEVIPPIQPAGDTKYVRHLRVQSDSLTKFWGRPIYLSAIVLIPEGFDTHPPSALSAHYFSRSLCRRAERFS